MYEADGVVQDPGLDMFRNADWHSRGRWSVPGTGNPGNPGNPIDSALDTDLPGSAKTLFAIVALRADEQNETVVTLREMAEQMATGINTVSRGFSTLEQGGYIRRKARSRVGDSTTLIVLPRSSV